MSDLVKMIIAFFIPPVAVFLESGLAKDFWINLILTCLFWLPGMIHAMIIITKK